MAQLIKAVVDTQKNSYKSIGQVNAGDDLELELEVKMNGKPIEFISPECELLAKKSDNNRIRQTKDILYQGGKFKIKVDRQGLTYPGVVTCQLLTKEDGRVSTCLFYFVVGTSLDREILQSIDKVEVLEQLDEYVAIAFANLQEYEQRIIASDASIRKLNEDMIAAEEVRDAAEAKRQEDYNTAEAGRNTKYTSSETDRDNRYREAEDSREQLYLQEKIDRNNKFNLEKEDRKLEFNQLKVKMEEATNTSKTEESKRAVVFSDLREAMEFLKATMTQNNNDMVDNEAERVAAELQRQSKFETMQQENNTFKQEINEQYETIVTENTKFKEDVNAKTGDIEVGYFDNKTYPNGKDRLDADFEDINRRLKEAELLNYNGGVMKCDSSCAGMTSDMLIKGRTLQNLFNVASYTSGASTTLTKEGDWYTWNFINEGSATATFNIKDSLFKNSTKYKCITYIKNNTLSTNFRIGTTPTFIFGDGKNTFARPTETGVVVYDNITSENITENKIAFYVPKCVIGESITFKIVILEDTQELSKFNLAQLNYFEGIQSVGENEKVGGKYKIGVKSTGKNLLNLLSMELLKSWQCNLIEKDKNTIKLQMTSATGVGYYGLTNFKVKPNTSYFIKALCDAKIGTQSIVIFDGKDLDNKSFFVSYSNQNGTINGKFTTPNNVNDLTFYIYPSQLFPEGINRDVVTFSEIQLEEIETLSTPITSYEPYISDEKYILLSEPLRSLPNGICDAIDKLGNEKRNIIKLDMSNLPLNSVKKLQSNMWTEKICSFYVDVAIAFGLPKYPSNAFNGYSGICSHFPLDEKIVDSKESEGFVVRFAAPNYIGFNILKSRLTDTTEIAFQKWLSDNEVIVYVSPKEEIPTIDHKKNMNLKTFEGVTHIESTNTLQADLSCKVPSKVQAVLQSTRLRNKELEKELTNTKEEVEILTIENEEVKAVNETQDILIDTTMLATDEVYTMLEPILEMIPQTMYLRSVSKMVDMYVAMIQRGLKTIEQVPARYREEVREILAKLEK